MGIVWAIKWDMGISAEVTPLKNDFSLLQQPSTVNSFSSKGRTLESPSLSVQ